MYNHGVSSEADLPSTITLRDTTTPARDYHPYTRTHPTVGHDTRIYLYTVTGRRDSERDLRVGVVRSVCATPARRGSKAVNRCDNDHASVINCAAKRRRRRRVSQEMRLHTPVAGVYTSDLAGPCPPARRDIVFRSRATDPSCAESRTGHRRPRPDPWIWIVNSAPSSCCRWRRRRRTAAVTRAVTFLSSVPVSDVYGIVDRRRTGRVCIVRRLAV